ncbi:MAG TPA: outer membrane lipoprotein-sorting protein [Chthoniobacter sp.]|jgi:hypothetical protein
MNVLRYTFFALAAILSMGAGLSLFADPASPASANELASRLSGLREDGSSYVRLRMEIKGAAPQTLQLQIKQRVTSSASEILYQVLFPKERKGEAVLLRRTGNRAASGTLFTPPNTVRPINDLKESLLGSDLSYEDIITNPYAWEHQAIVGNETIQGAPCQILESKPGSNDHSTYASVRSWIDPRRMVPLRIEEYSGPGKLVRRIDTTRVVSEAGRHIPADLIVQGTKQGSSTVIDGSRIRHGVAYSDTDFTGDGMKDLSPPRGGAE